MGNAFDESLFSRLKQATGYKTTPVIKDAPAQTEETFVLGEALEKNIPDSTRRQELYEGTIQPVLRKLLRTSDVGVLRVGTVSDRMYMRRNKMTPTLNWLESRGTKISRDYQFEWREASIGSQLAEDWQIEGDLPSEVANNYIKRSNTINCVGNTVNVSMITQEMLEQQAGIDFLAEQIDTEVTRIRRKINFNVIQGSESKGEGPNGVPKMGGFTNRSPFYTLNATGADLNRSIIQGRVDAIANASNPQGYGYERPWLGITSSRQLQVLRDIMISEYNGIDPISLEEFKTELMDQLLENNARAQAVFNIIPGGVMGFFYDPQLPTGTTIIMDSDKPYLVKMQLMGQFGPWVIHRPTTNLQSLNVCFDLCTLQDGPRESRAIVSSLAG